MSEGAGSLVRYLLVFTAAVVFATASLLSYSTEGYTLAKYPGLDGSAVVCVEGEVDPTNQTITVLNDGEEPTVNPHVTVNGVRHDFNYTLGDKGLRQRTNALRLGCNEVSLGADTDTAFKARIEYLSHWRPVVKYLEIGNLQVGHSVRYFISTEDADGRKAEVSRLNITDITRNIENTVFSGEFNGSAVRYKMEEPGNYKADMQVYDGYVWSDWYEAGFTSHVITTEEQRKAYKLHALEDDPVRETEGYVPAAIHPDDNPGIKWMKKGVDGCYMLVKRTVDYARYRLSRL
jgi:hypothetical protein